MLKYGKVVIDYMRNRFYFFPYESGTEDMTGKLKNWNVGILPVKGHFEITAVWDSAKDLVALGDQVIRVKDVYKRQEFRTKYISESKIITRYE